MDLDALPAAASSSTVDVPDGGALQLTVGPVAKRIGDLTVPMLAYGGSIPGPTLRVAQGSEIAVTVTNATDMETTVHWHGLRLRNEYDGVPHATQAPINPGASYTHRLTFPDAGLFWYHPHMREDYAQELGLYGNVVVEPADPDYWPPADREIVLTLDDLLVEDGVTPFDTHHPDFTAMGRFGNVLLVGGEPHQDYEVRRGEIVRFALTNTANTRVFKVAVPGCRMKLVGGDGGRYEHETLTDGIVVAPSERAVVDILFDEQGRFEVQHVTPDRTYSLADVTVAAGPLDDRHVRAFLALRTNPEMVGERERATPYLAAPPDKTLALVAEMNLETAAVEGPVVYVCPMHPEVVRDAPGSCPLCGMKLLSQAAVPAAGHGDEGHGGAGHGEPTSGDHTAEHGHAAAASDGIEWEDDMFEVNRTTTPANTRWKIVDRDTGLVNQEIDWTFTAGEQVKIRLVNEMESDHPMHHPFHVHGERFLVLARDGTAESNLVWKDTVLVRRGETVDILLDTSNPGLWMAHCHIAEHMEGGMMFTFRVRQPAG